MPVPISKNLETNYRERNFIPQVDYAWETVHRQRYARAVDENRMQAVKACMARGGYLGGKSLGDQGEQYTPTCAGWETTPTSRPAFAIA
jgi:hypothetical protein